MGILEDLSGEYSSLLSEQAIRPSGSFRQQLQYIDVKKEFIMNAELRKAMTKMIGQVQPLGLYQGDTMTDGFRADSSPDILAVYGYAPRRDRLVVTISRDQMGIFLTGPDAWAGGVDMRVLSCTRDTR